MTEETEIRITENLLTILITILLGCVVYFHIARDTEASSTEHYGAARVDRVIKVYDGDTIFVDVDKWPPVIGKNVGVRISGIDTPEIRAKCEFEERKAIKARDFVIEKLNNAKEIELRNIVRGKFFRIAADVYVDGESLARTILEKGLAYHYGRYDKKTNWCILQ